MCSAGFAHTGLTHGLSRMTGNCHVRFLGEGAAAMPLPYPTAEVGCGGCEPSFKRLQVAPGLSSRFLTGPRSPTVRQKMFPLLAVELAVDGGYVRRLVFERFRFY